MFLILGSSDCCETPLIKWVIAQQDYHASCTPAFLLPRRMLIGFKPEKKLNSCLWKYDDPETKTIPYDIGQYSKLCFYMEEGTVERLAGKTVINFLSPIIIKRIAQEAGWILCFLHASFFFFLIYLGSWQFKPDEKLDFYENVAPLNKCHSWLHQWVILTWKGEQLTDWLVKNVKNILWIYYLSYQWENVSAKPNGKLQRTINWMR